MSNIFFTADPHFFHNKIRQYENRPFISVEAMNHSLIENWNNTVHKRAEVYVLGDFSFGKFDETKAIFDKLKGTKHLIMGNHDRSRSRSWWKRIGFDIVINNPIIFYQELFILSHEPLKSYELPIAYKNIHGHTHMQKLTPDGHRFKCIGIADKNAKYINVGVDVTNFKPVSLESLI